MRTSKELIFLATSIVYYNYIIRSFARSFTFFIIFEKNAFFLFITDLCIFLSKKMTWISKLGNRGQFEFYFQIFVEHILHYILVRVFNFHCMFPRFT